VKRFWSAALAVSIILITAAPVLASVVTGALYKADLTATNTSYDAQRVSVPFTLSTQSLLNGYYINSSYTNVALQDTTGNDIPFMPAQGAGDKWVMFLPQIPQNSAMNYHLFTGGTTAMNGKLRYFPDAAGMGVADSASLEPGNSFEIEVAGYFDTTAGAFKQIVNKNSVFSLIVSASNTITATLTRTGTNTLDQSSTYTPTTSGVYGANWAGNTFTPSVTAPLNVMELFVKKTGAPAGNATVSIYATSGGLPTGAALATQNITASTSSTSFAWVPWTFASPPALTAGTLYAWVLSVPSGDVSNRLENSIATPGIYPNGAHVYSGNSGGTWFSNGNDCGFKAYSSAVRIISASTTSGEHTVKVTADGTNFKIYVDGVEKQSEPLLGTSVPNNASNWTFVENNSVPYVEYIKVKVGGVLKGHWVWQNAATFTDQSGNGNTGSPSFRTTTTDADVSVAIKGFAAVEQSLFSSGDSDAGPEIVADNDIPAMPAGWYINLHAETFPGGTQINDFFNGIDIPPLLFWICLAYGGGAIIVMLVHKWTKKVLPSGGAGIIWNVFFAATVGTGFWGLVPIGMITLGEMLNRKKASV
jgi:hypothetical protein